MLSLIGIADAGFMTYEEVMGIVPQCTGVAGFDCGKVLQSSWAYIGPVPLAALGLGFYLFMFALNSYLLLVPQPWARLKQLRLLAATSAFGFSLWLIFLQAVVIGAFCLYCTISAATSTGLFLLSWLHAWSEKKGLHDSSTE